MRWFGDGMWLVLGQTTTAIGLLIGTRLLTELLSPTELGKVALMTGLVGLVTNTFLLPWIRGAYRLFPEMAAQNQTYLLRNAISRHIGRFGGMLAAAFIAIGLILSQFADISAVACLLSGAAILIEGQFRLETTLCAAERRQRVYAIWTTCESLSRITLALLMSVFFQASCESVLAGYIIATLLAYMAGKALQPILPPRQQQSTMAIERTTELNKYAYPLMPQAVVGWASATADRYIVCWELGSGAVGIYATIYGLIARALSFIVTPIELTMRPIYFTAVANKQRTQERRVFFTWLAAITPITILSTFLVYFFSDWISFLLLAEQYRASATLTPILAAGFSAMALAALVNEINAAYKNTRAILIGDIVSAIVGLVSAVPLIRLFGLSGAAYATCLSYVTQLVVACYLSRQTLKEHRAIDGTS